MEKKTVWAIVLVAVILIVSMTIQPLFFKSQNNAKNISVNDELNSSENISQTENLSQEEKIFLATEAEDKNIVEETFVVETEEVRVTFSNRGGDIIGYELKKHTDKDTGRGIEMVDNATEFNRACSMNLGGADGVLLNGLFKAAQETDGEKQIILFTKNVSVPNKNDGFSNFVIGKRYTFVPGEYLFKLEILIHADDGVENLNENGAAYTIRTSPQIGPHFDQSKNRYEMRQFLAFNGKKIRRVAVGKNQFKQYEKEIMWGGIAGKYFEALIVPESPLTVEKFFYSSRVEKDDYANAQAFLTRKSFSQKDVHDTYYIYFGPREEKALLRYNSSENNGWNLSTMRLNDTLVSSGWLSWLEKILKVVLEFIFKLTKNWGISIIILTVLLKLAMFPLTHKQSMGTLKMQKIQPRMQELQAKYKENPQKMQAELQKLYQEVGYNPMSGCLPLLFQFLVLFAMFNLFNNYFEFRGAVFIEAWIPDLSAGDKVYTFQKNLPFIGNQLHVLPIIYLISQLLFGKITQNGGTATGQNATQMKMMMYGMPLIFFFIFYNAPSGLLLYWTVSNILQLVQQLIINRIMKDKKFVVAKKSKK